MKKYTCIIICALLALGFASCRKNAYTCRCTYAFTGSQEDISIKASNYAKAEAICQYYGKDEAVDGPSCRMLDQ